MISGFTLAYLARLLAWGWAAGLVEGVVIAASWMLVSRLTCGAYAETRHRLACAHFAAVIAGPFITVALVQTFLMASVDEGALAQAREAGALAPATQVVSLGAEAFALVWLAGVVVLFTRLGVAWLNTGRLARQAPSPTLTCAVGRLARRMGLSPTPEVMSANVPAPCVLNVTRPVILTPRDIEDRLPALELEAVLAHELAHVARGDFGWNLVQRAALALAWPHPAAWRMHAILQREREMRCDALAARTCGGPVPLARGLVRLAEAHAPPHMVLAQGSGGAALAARLERLAEAPGETPRTPPLAPLILAAASLLVVAALAVRAADPALPSAYVASAFGPTVSFDAHDGAGAFRVSVRQGRVVSAALGSRPARIQQSGRRVTILDAAGRPALSLTVDPRGAIAWASRKG